MPADRSTVAKRRARQAIAAHEALKGIAALAAIVGVLDLMYRDVRHLAVELLKRARRYAFVTMRNGGLPHQYWISSPAALSVPQS